MRVIVTRPALSARTTAAKLAAMGHEPVLLPLAEPLHDAEAAAKAIAMPHAALAVTSAEAIRVLATLGDAIAPLLSTPLYAVGRATGEVARGLGFRNVVTGSGTGEALAQLLANEAEKLEGPLLYLAGKPRSPRFEEGLAAGNIAFVTMPVYEMIPVELDVHQLRKAAIDPPADALLLYSRENALLFFDLAAALVDHLHGLRILCLSAAIAEAVAEPLRKNVAIAEDIDEDALLALLALPVAASNSAAPLSFGPVSD